MTNSTLNENLMASGDYLESIRNFALSKGITFEALLDGSTLSHHDLLNPPKYMPNFISSKIGLNLYHHLKNPISDAAEFGLCMTASSHGSLGIVVQSVSTVREAYQALKDYYHTRNKAQDIYLDECTTGLTITLSEHYENEDLDEDIKRFFDLAILVSIAANNHQAPYQSKPKDRIHLFVDASEPENFPFDRLKCIEIKFNASMLKLFIPKWWLDSPLELANSDVASAAIERCEQELLRLNPKDLVAKIEIRLRESAEKLPSLEDTADHLNMSPASLKRKLKDVSTSYQEIKNQVRLAKAYELLRSNKHGIEYTAEQLGFSDASNFTKAFKKLTGKTPKEFREQI